MVYWLKHLRIVNEVTLRQQSQRIMSCQQARHRERGARPTKCLGEVLLSLTAVGLGHGEWRATRPGALGGGRRDACRGALGVGKGGAASKRAVGGEVGPPAEGPGEKGLMGWCRGAWGRLPAGSPDVTT